MTLPQIEAVKNPDFFRETYYTSLQPPFNFSLDDVGNDVCRMRMLQMYQNVRVFVFPVKTKR